MGKSFGSSGINPGVGAGVGPLPCLRVTAPSFPGFLRGSRPDAIGAWEKSRPADRRPSAAAAAEKAGGGARGGASRVRAPARAPAPGEAGPPPFPPRSLSLGRGWGRSVAVDDRRAPAARSCLSPAAPAAAVARGRGARYVRSLRQAPAAARTGRRHGGRLVHQFLDAQQQQRRRRRRRPRQRRPQNQEEQRGDPPPGEAALLLHRPDRHGHPELAVQAADPQRDLPVPAGALPLLPRLLPGLEELGAPQPLAQRVLHQAAQRAGPAWQGPLLDHRPGQRVHVRGGLLPTATPGLQEEVPGLEAHVQHDELEFQPPPRRLRLPGTLLPAQRPALGRGRPGHGQRGRHGAWRPPRVPVAFQRRPPRLHEQLRRRGSRAGLGRRGLRPPRRLGAGFPAAARRRGDGAPLGLLRHGALGLGSLARPRLERRRLLHQAAASLALQPGGKPALLRPPLPLLGTALPAPEQPQPCRPTRNPVPFPISEYVRPERIRLLHQRHGVFFHAFRRQRLLLPPASHISRHQTLRDVTTRLGETSFLGGGERIPRDPCENPRRTSCRDFFFVGSHQIFPRS